MTLHTQTHVIMNIQEIKVALGMNKLELMRALDAQGENSAFQYCWIDKANKVLIHDDVVAVAKVSSNLFIKVKDGANVTTHIVCEGKHEVVSTL